MEIKTGEFLTADMGLAASLMVDGVIFRRMEKDPERERRLFFVFDENSDIGRIQLQRANGTHVVSSTSYDEALRKIKTLIHSII